MKLILWVKAIMFGRYMYVRHSILSYSNTCEHLRLFITYKFVHVSLFCDMNLLVLFWGQHTHHYIYIYIYIQLCARYVCTPMCFQESRDEIWTQIQIHSIYSWRNTRAPAIQNLDLLSLHSLLCILIYNSQAPKEYNHRSPYVFCYTIHYKVVCGPICTLE